jgi:endonuclease YncB( thermonuclease family)
MRFQTIVTAGLITTLIGLSYLYTSPKSAQGSAASPELTGVASVIDGDTLEIHGERIRLHGIDAPEADQVCTSNSQQYRCGQKAALALSDFIARQTVFCGQRDTDRYGRVVAVCSVAGQDLGAWMVSRGHALAYRKYSLDYVPEEEAAAAARQGMWAGEFQPPWEWRRR